MRINNLRYNGRKMAFEASVDITRDGMHFRYPCELRAPIGTDPAYVNAALAQTALRMSDTATA